MAEDKRIGFTDILGPVANSNESQKKALRDALGISGSGEEIAAALDALFGTDSWRPNRPSGAWPIRFPITSWPIRA